ncbi:MAG: PIN domain-containing protein [Deltaproteobacteria bacterium]|nr:PIN domain-containing protein [Deltaproteobacteria bacterium]
MIFVDSSVWIDFFHDSTTPLTARLWGLIDAETVALPVPVRIELLNGARPADRESLVDVLDPLVAVAPRESTWRLIETWIQRAVKSGHQFGVVDLLIGALAAEHSGAVWSLDRDFERMARLGFVKLYSPEEMDA